MGIKVGFIVVFVLGASLACESRELGIANIFTGTTDSKNAVLPVNHLDTDKKTLVSKEVGRQENICAFCEEFTAEALSYFAVNKTQTEILQILHKTCSKLPFYKQECAILVDYYAPLFFLEVSSAQPGDFCRKVNLCEQAVFISQRLSKDSCEFCRDTVAEALLKLKDPNIQLQILEKLLKECHAVKVYEKQCKQMVFEYGPIILANAELLLESNDICSMLHACELPKANTSKAFTGETIMVATS